MAALNKITWDDKVNTRTNALARINKVIDDDMNEIKAVVNAAITFINANTKTRSVLTITSADFTAGVYQNNALKTLTPGTDFNVFTNEGSGILLAENNGYTFDSGLGKLTMGPQNYFIEIYS